MKTIPYMIFAAGAFVWGVLAQITPVNPGLSPGDGTGDPFRTAIIKLNANDSNLLTKIQELTVATNNVLQKLDITNGTALNLNLTGLTTGLEGRFTKLRIGTPTDGVGEDPDVVVAKDQLDHRVTAIVGSMAELLSLSTKEFSRDAIVTSGEWANRWLWCETETLADNGQWCRRPTSYESDATPGRWMYAGTGGSTITVPSIAELLSLPPSYFSPEFIGTNETFRAQAFVEGYYEGSTLGAGYYNFTTDLSGTNAYGGKLAVSGGAWELTGRNTTVFDFGAVGDDATEHDLRIDAANDWAASRPVLTQPLVSKVSNVLTTANGFLIPDGMPSIYHNGTEWVTDASATDYRFASPEVTYYFDALLGNDANDGLSLANPKQNISTLIVELNAIPSTNGRPASVKMLLAGEQAYTASASFNAKDPLFDLEIRPITNGTYAYIGSGRSGTEFTLLGGSVYKRTAHVATNVVTWIERDQYGAALKLTYNSTAWADEAALAAGLGEGEWCSFIGADTYTNCYVRMPDSSVPNYKTLTVGIYNDDQPSLDVANRNFHVERVRMTGHGGGLKWSSSTTNNVHWTMYDVEVCGNTDTTRNLIYSQLDSGFQFFERCRADHGITDGFNYHQSSVPGFDYTGWFLELNCAGTQNGDSDSDNGSTAHEKVTGVRVNGYYVRNWGRNVHDVNEARSVVVKTRAGLSQGTDPGTDVAFEAGQGGLSTYVTKMWLIDCESLGAARDYYAGELSKMYLMGSSATEKDVVVYADAGAEAIRLLSTATPGETTTRLRIASNLADVESVPQARINLGIFRTNGLGVGVSNSVAETTVAGYTIPAGTITSDGDMLTMVVPAEVFNNSGGTITLHPRVYVNGVEVIGATTATVSANASYRPSITKVNIGRTGAAKAMAYFEMTMDSVNPGAGTTGLGTLASNLGFIYNMGARNITADWDTDVTVSLTMELSTATTNAIYNPWAFSVK